MNEREERGVHSNIRIQKREQMTQYIFVEDHLGANVRMFERETNI
jgi:hypothetical protein